ncbi:Sugar phosphatase YbiV [anaerobic digester metagenome]|uniref:HAD family hydrolase n=1 Tax=Oscillibacter ruminantium TaxID=1263547 RepID=UPI0002D36859|nr:HAD family hydrolase [Oscillibacter ruminantium]
MIRLIASDIDGTLLPYGETAMPQRLFPLIHRLRDRGILFAPASGRQYHSLRTLFAPVADEACFLCENGAVLYGPGTEEGAPLLSKTPLPRQEALELAHTILGLSGCDVVIEGQTVNYVCGGSPAFLRQLTKGHGNLVQTVDQPEDISEDIVKIAAFCPTGFDEPVKILGPRWGDWFHMAVAGLGWLDFTLATKGSGLSELCAGLGLSLSETAVFGDNWNDQSMLHAAGRAYLMEAADPALRQALTRSRADEGRDAPRVCENVCDELEAILQCGP